jgi:hypothetical protein
MTASGARDLAAVKEEAAIYSRLPLPVGSRHRVLVASPSCSVLPQPPRARTRASQPMGKPFEDYTRPVPRGRPGAAPQSEPCRPRRRTGRWAARASRDCGWGRGEAASGREWRRWGPGSPPASSGEAGAAGEAGAVVGGAIEGEGETEEKRRSIWTLA